MDMDSMSEESLAGAGARERWPAIIRPGDPGTPVDWGRLEREGAQWRWPFQQMEIGDTFHIEAGDAKVTYVRARAHNQGKAFKFSVREDRMDGTIMVQRVAEAGVGWARVGYKVVCSKIETIYGVEFDMVRWGDLTMDEALRTDAPATKAIPRPSYIFTALASSRDEPNESMRTYAAELDPNGFTLTRVDDEMTQEQWNAQRLQEALS
jgi:hypothetical protein